MSDLSAFPITARWPATDASVIQLYSFPTPNGVKISIALEEMGLPYEPHLVTLKDADVKSEAFTSLNLMEKSLRSLTRMARMDRSASLNPGPFLSIWPRSQAN